MSDQKNKKILLTISRGSLARDLLQNEFYKILREHAEVVILTPAAADERFVKEFGYPGVRFIFYEEKLHTAFDRFIFFFHKNLIYNPTVNKKNRWGIIGSDQSKRPLYIGFLIKKLIFLPLSKIGFLREIFREIDYRFLQRSEVEDFKKILDEESPDIIVSTNIASDAEAALMKAARKSGITTIGMPKSWDNPSKVGFRAKADYMVVWNSFMAKEVKDFQNYPDTRIKIVGVPKFDFYFEKERIWSREKFCEIYGLDKDRKIIFYGSEGKLFPSDSEVTSIIRDYIKNDELPKLSQMLIRPHYGYKNDEQKFKHLFGDPHVVVDLYNKPSNAFRDRWDYSDEFLNRFVNCLYHSNMVLSSYSTLSIDGFVFDRPAICICFDGFVRKPYNQSIARWGEVNYNKVILETNALTPVYSKEELKSALDAHLRDPDCKKKEREAIREKLFYKLDGKSGRRFADFVLSHLK